MSTSIGKLRVCRSTLLRILTPVTVDRLKCISKKVLSNKPLTERRGGDRRSKNFSDKKTSVHAFINRFPACESHYGAGKSRRIYLSTELNTKKMWRMYNKSVDALLKVSFSYFRNIFVSYFNLGFSTPRVDSCTSCERLKNQLNVCYLESMKVKLQTELRVHKLRAKSFYELMKHDNIYSLAVDLQAVHNIPKLTVQECYYSRQLGLYNLGICDLTSQKNFCYTWLECQSGRGSNEVASALIDYIHNHLTRNVGFLSKTVLRVFMDGCGGQNKNHTMVTAMASILRTMCNVGHIELIYPVRGHSFLPCDRVFGRINRDLRKKTQ